MNPRLAISCLVATAAGLCSPSPVAAGFPASVTVETTALPAGDYRYEYTLSVDPTSEFAAIDFDLSVSPAANLTAVTAPAGWDFAYAPGEAFIYWYAPFDDSANILPGFSGSFSFVSPLAPGPRGYSISGLDPSFSLDFASGSVDGPSFAPSPPVTGVPAPAGLVLALTGSACLGGFGWLRRRRPAEAG